MQESGCPVPGQSADGEGVSGRVEQGCSGARRDLGDERWLLGLLRSTLVEGDGRAARGEGDQCQGAAKISDGSADVAKDGSQQQSHGLR